MKWIALLLFTAGAAMAQPGPFIPLQYTSLNPNGNVCSSSSPLLYYITGNTLYGCSSGAYAVLTGGGGGGGVTSFTVAGTANQITATGTCTVTTTGTCTLSLPAGLIIPGTINKLTLTQPATGSTFTLADGKTLTTSNTLTLAGTDGASINFGAGGTVSYTTGTVTSVSFTGGIISVATPTSTPAFTVAGMSGGVPYFSSASTWASSGALASGQFVLGGGAGSAPTTSFSVVPVANGGTATGSTLTGVVRGGNPFTASELSGDATTSGSNAVTVAKVNGNTPGGTCTNQFVRSLNSSAVPTCNTVVNADIANTTIDLTAKVTGVLPSANSQPHMIGFVIDGGGSAITTGDIKVYPTADFACTINRWDISADQSGSITVDVWKAATAIPTSGNKISASAPLTLSSAQLAQNGSRTGWTTAVSVGDVFGFSVATVSTVTRVVGQIWCQ
jgi:hypothetical protein